MGVPVSTVISLYIFAVNTSNYKSDNCAGFWLSWLTVFSACPAATMFGRYFSYQHLSMLNPTTVQASGCAGWLPSQPVLLYCNVVVLLLCHGEKSWVSFSVYCSQINHLFSFLSFSHFSKVEFKEGKCWLPIFIKSWIKDNLFCQIWVPKFKFKSVNKSEKFAQFLGKKWTSIKFGTSA